MEKFYLEEPTIERKNEAFEYLNEFVRFDSELNGTGSMDKCLDGWTYEEFLIETNMGYLVIKGENLEIVKLDTKDGIVSIKGSFISLSYIEELKKMNKENSLFNKLFK